MKGRFIMELQSIKNDIDQIDNELVKLFEKRLEKDLLITKYKDENKILVLDKNREREILTRIIEMVDPKLESYTKILYSMIFSLSRQYQAMANIESSLLEERIQTALEKTPKQFPTKAVVACQGVEGAYSQIACDKLFSLPHIMFFNNFKGVFQAVEKGMCQYGILPIENSLYGSVTQVYDLMKQHNFHIARSIKLKIDHVLLTKPGSKISDIKEIFSHEQAIGQCNNYLQNMKNIKVTVCENTAVAAELVASSQRNDIAALSSENCAELYGLEILSSNVQDNGNNYTRFICISKNLEIYPGAGKVSLILSVPHKPGSLFEMISKFSALGLNLTKMESRPIPGKDFEFMFYLDMDASIYNDSVIKLLNQLSNNPSQFVFLGSYSEI